MFKSLKVLVILIFFALAVTGCTDGQKLDDIDKNQKELLTKMQTIENNQNNILAKLSAFDTNQKEMMKFFKPRKPQVDINKVHNLPAGNSPFKGSEKAVVTITEFSDYQCPYCEKVQPTLKKVIEAYPDDVKLVFKNFPLSFHKQAKDAARAAHAAGEQGKYWEMHDLIFENAKKLNDDKFKEFAAGLQLDVDRFMADYKSGKYDKQIEEDINLGRNSGVRGTPTFFVNGKRMTRRSFDDFKKTIDGYLKKK